MSPSAARPVARVNAPRAGVVALVCDRENVARLQAVVRGGVPGMGNGVPAGTTLQCVDRVAELRSAVAARRPAVVVVEARDADGVATAEAVRDVRASAPDVVVLGYTRLRLGMSAAVLAFAAAGIHELVIAGIDDEGKALRDALGSAVQRAGSEHLVASVVALVPDSLAGFVRYTFEHFTEATTLADVAKALTVSRQTLLERTRRAGLPGPRELSTWCRLLLAAQTLGEPACTVDDVAWTYGFPSGNGLRNVLRRYADVSVEDVRRQGVQPVLDRLREAIAAGRAVAASGA